MASKTGAKTPKLILEYRKERNKIVSRERALKKKGYTITQSFVPKIINQKDFKTQEDWGKLKREINRLKEITPNVQYKGATWQDPSTREILSGREAKTRFAREAGKKGYVTRQRNKREKLSNRIQQVISEQRARDEARLADKLRREEEEAVRVSNERNEIMDKYKDNLETLSKYGISNPDDFDRDSWIDKQMANDDTNNKSWYNVQADKIEEIIYELRDYENKFKTILGKDIKAEIIKRDVLNVEEPITDTYGEGWEDVDNDFYGEDEDEPLTGWHDESYDEDEEYEEYEEDEPIENQRRKFKRPKETPLEEARNGDEYSSEWMSVTWDVFQYISDKIEAAFNNNKGGFVRRKGSGGKHNRKVEYDFEPDKQALLRLWRNTVDRYSETKNTMKELVKYIEDNEGRINEILQDIEWYIDQASYEAGYTELANILNVHPLTLAEAQELEEDRY